MTDIATRSIVGGAMLNGVIGTACVSRLEDNRVFLDVDPEGVYLTPEQAWSLALKLLNHAGANMCLIDGGKFLSAVKPTTKDTP